MFKQLFIFLFVIALGFTTVAPQVHAVDMSTALKRMDAIIAEMQALRTEFASLSSVTTVSAPSPAVQGAVSGGVLGDDLAFGSTNDDIKRIQKLLATDSSIYPYGVASGFFGPKTQEAIRMFQSRFGLDTVGVVGPSTRALLEVFFASYPDGNYPADILKQAKPTARPVATAQTTTAPAPAATTGDAREINVTLEDDEALIEIVFADGTRKGYVADTDDEDEVVAFIVRQTSLTATQVTAVIDFETKRRSSSRSDDNDEDDAEDAMDDAEDAIDDVETEIEEADDDGDDVDWAEDTLDDAKDLLKDAEDAYDDEDYDEAVELAEEAQELAEKAEDRIDEEKGDDQGDSEDIDSIEAEVGEDESDITVEYDDGNEYTFSVDEDTESNIIEEVADELDMDEDDVEDIIEFDFGRISKIDVDVEKRDGESLAFVEYRSGAVRRVWVSEVDEDDIIKELADELDEEEDEIEDWTSFD